MTGRGAARRGRFCRAAEARSQRDPGGEHRAGAVGIEPPACRSQGGGSERKAQLGALGTAQRPSRIATSPSRTAGMSSIALVSEWEWQLGALAGPAPKRNRGNPGGGGKRCRSVGGIPGKWKAAEAARTELEAGSSRAHQSAGLSKSILPSGESGSTSGHGEFLGEPWRRKKAPASQICVITHPVGRSCLILVHLSSWIQPEQR
ncbi:uncharacterized protein LOC116447984 isoform X1 [Corvus moneduloides]|uniref:uncharacterized protein LOC116447984 isoform X1 n=1 Tax=Corvus moneduloides TaxID=1196302 RepID=UPI00136346CF|nr:uncharacterized protein LOC116447984 isoform X1 [Corvus moneduloides]